MKHLSRIQRKESNKNRISSANKARFEDQLPVDMFIPSVFSERKPVASIDEDVGKSFLKLVIFFMVEEVYSPGIYRPYGFGFIVGCDIHSETTSYSVRYTPAYDSGRIYGKAPLIVYTHPSYSDSYFGVGSTESKIRKCVNMVTLEKRVVVKKERRFIIANSELGT